MTVTFHHRHFTKFFCQFDDICNQTALRATRQRRFTSGQRPSTNLFGCSRLPVQTRHVRLPERRSVCSLLSIAEEPEVAAECCSAINNLTSCNQHSHCTEMPFAVAVTPKLVRMLDFDGNPADTWVVECPFWLAKYLCDSAQKEGEIFREQQRAFLEQQRLQNPQFSVFYISGIACFNITKSSSTGEVFNVLLF